MSSCSKDPFMKCMGKFILLLAVLPFVSCGGPNGEKGNACVVVDFIGAQERTVYMDEVFDSVEIVPLETSSSCLLTGEPFVLALTDSFVVLSNSTREAFLFDWASGRFVHRIGRQGNGPNEYFYLVFDACFDRYNDVIYANRGNKWIGLSIKGDGVGDLVCKPKMSEEEGFLGIINPYRLNDSLYIGYVNNLTGDEKLKLVVFNREGNVVQTYPNQLRYFMERPFMASFCPGYFYKYDTELCFYGGVYKDTIYTVERGRLSPKYAITLNEKSPYKALEASEHESKKFNYLVRMMEYEPYLLFSHFGREEVGTGVGFYDKKKRKTVRSKKTDGGFVSRDGKGPSFFFRYMDDRGYVVGYWTATQWIDFLEKHGQPESFSESLLNIKYDDNPILVVARVKK